MYVQSICIAHLHFASCCCLAPLPLCALSPISVSYFCCYFISIIPFSAFAVSIMYCSFSLYFNAPRMYACKCVCVYGATNENSHRPRCLWRRHASCNGQRYEASYASPVGATVEQQSMCPKIHKSTHTHTYVYTYTHTVTFACACNNRSATRRVCCILGRVSGKLSFVYKGNSKLCNCCWRQQYSHKHAT